MSTADLHRLLVEAIDEAKQTSRFGSLYSAFGVTDAAGRDLASAFYQAAPELVDAYQFAEAYFLSHAHGDPTLSGLPWEEASRQLDAVISRLEGDSR